MDVNEFIQNNEVTIRLGFFLGVFTLIALWELISPRRDLSVSKALRWANNLALVFFNTLILRLIFPAAAVGVAVTAQQNSWGMFNLVDVPALLAITASVVIMDFVIYMQHVMVHAVPVLWRLHRMHHADLDYDVTTGSRFHTIEIILSMLIKFATIVLIGPPVVAVIVFEVVLNAMAMFNHGNIYLPKSLDRVLRWFIVTPDMHRVHHSVEDDETNSNFGFNLSWWDRLLGTYRDQPRGGHLGMTIGIHGYRETKQATWITGMLAMPFAGKVTGYAINRRQWGEDNEQ